MDRKKLQELAQQQQRNHLALAQRQALHILIDSQAPRLTVERAMQYHNVVFARLTPQEYEEFRNLWKSNRKPNNDAILMISKMCRLLQPHPDLLQGFGMFLPSYINFQVQTGGLFRINSEVYRFADPLKTEDEERNQSGRFDSECGSSRPGCSGMSQPGSSGMSGAGNSGTSKAGHSSTVEDIQHIKGSKKASSVPQKIDQTYVSLFHDKVKDRFKDKIEVYNQFRKMIADARKDNTRPRVDIESELYQDICDLFQNENDLIEEFRPIVPHAIIPEEYERVKVSAVNDPSIANVYKYGTFEEHEFFDKVRKAVEYEEVYCNFLKCLNLYTLDIVTRPGLVNIVTPFLGRYPELIKQLKDMLGLKESGQNVEPIPLRIIELEKQRLDPEVASDIDYATGGRNGTSYRALPRDGKQPTCSGRTKLCKEVLNDTWVSFPSSSEDSRFDKSSKTKYEEAMYRIEDERFELDNAIQANDHTIEVLENVQKKINKMTSEEKSEFRLDDTLGGTSTVLHQKALHRCYGAKTDELVAGLKKNPIVAIPIILKRMRAKAEEWKAKQQQFNLIWRRQVAENHIKSLDIKGVSFRQNDVKTFRPKNLLSEMETIRDEKKADHISEFYTPHFTLEFKEICVFIDASNLICQYLKKLPGVSRDDRRRIELIVRNFFPDFFCFPRAIHSENEAVDDDEVQIQEEIIKTYEVNDGENDKDEQIDHTSPTGSAVICKVEVFSDPEESNSIEENDNESEKSDKSSFIEDSDIFDKLDALLPTNLPYTLLFVNKHWYVLFRQFHLLCERLSRLLQESNRICAPPAYRGDGTIDEDTVDVKPTYPQLISKLSMLLIGALDYSRFENESRSLFGIHAYVSFTMDKLILSIVRQLQQIVGDDISKQSTAFFYQHNKIIANGSYCSALECLQVEKHYLKKVERIMDEEKCFRVLWHKKEQTLTIEFLENEAEKIYDLHEVEKFSNYVDDYLIVDSVSEDVLKPTGFYVFLKRNLKRQKKFWQRKVDYIENLWKKRQTWFEKSHPEFLCQQKSNMRLSSSLTKRCIIPKEKFVDIVGSASAEMVNPKSSNSGYKVVDNSENIDVTTQSFDNSNEVHEETLVTKQESTVNEKGKTFAGNTEVDSNVFKVSKHSEKQVLEIKTEKLVDDTVMDAAAFICSAAEPQERENIILYDALLSGETSKNAQDSKESIFIIDSAENINTVAAFHDINEQIIGSEVVIDMKSESDAVEVFTAPDTCDNEKAFKDTALVDVKEEPVSPEPEECEYPPKIAKSAKKTGSKARRRKQRTLPEYTKRRTKRANAKSPKKAKDIQKQEEIDYTFDYTYFSSLDDENKIWYLIMKDMTVKDDTECTFKRGSYKMSFVQNLGTFLYRHNCLHKAKKIHQQISEIKTSNFNEWHRVWLDRYVTPSMLRSCNDWLLKGDFRKFKIVCSTVNECTKPPYMPFTKYRVGYFKTVS